MNPRRWHMIGLWIVLLSTPLMLFSGYSLLGNSKAPIKGAMIEKAEKAEKSKEAVLPTTSYVRESLDAATHFATVHLADVPSLQGTDIPEGLLADERGHLIITPQLKRVFSYFYTLMGRKDEEEIDRLLLRYISQRFDTPLEAPAREQAIAIANQMKALEDAIESLPVFRYEEHRDTAALMEYLNARNALRQQYLGRHVADVFYGSEQEYDEYTMQRIEIGHQPFQTDHEKREATRVLLRALSPVNRDAVLRSQRVALLTQLDTQAKQNEFTSDELFTQRQALVGREAATRLHALDMNRAAWNQRYQQYRAHVDSIERSELSAIDKEQSITALQHRHFRHAEIKRVNSLDRITALKALKDQ